MVEAKLYLSQAKKHKLFPSYRLLVTILGFAGCLVRQASNNALNFSIVCMVNSSSYLEKQNTPLASSCALNATKDYTGTYNWDRDKQAYIISALSIGTMLLIFPGGVICDKFGVKRLYIFVMFLLCLTNCIIPVVSDHLGWVGLFVVRFVQGAAMVVGWPAILVVSNQWFVSSEITFFQVMASSGSQFGAIASMLISGEFCKHIGWRYIYYLFGALSGLVGVAWLLLYSDSAESAHFISESERQYVIRGRRWTKPTVSIPWRSVLTSLPVWAIIVINFGNMYLFYFIGQFGPTYYKEVLGIDPSSSAIFSALPFFCQLIGRNVASVVLRACEDKISINLFVKLASIPSGLIPGVFMFVVTAFDCDTKYVAVAIFALSFFFFGWIMVGFIRATGSIAPQYTGTLTGFSQTAMFVSAVACPFITGALTPHSTVAEWKNALYVTGCICILGTMFFMIFGSAELQPWAVVEKPAVAQTEKGNKQGAEFNSNPPTMELFVIGYMDPSVSGEVAY